MNSKNAILLLSTASLFHFSVWATPTISSMWASGSNTNGQSGSYGTEGTGSTLNFPGARAAAAGAGDGSGNLWLFGGWGYDSTGSYDLLNDFWKYQISNSNWTWMNGSNVVDQNGVYGTQGTPSASNIPGARTFSTSWVDSNGDFWVFGGEGFDSVGGFDYLNDLWKYNHSTNQWTWISGSQYASQNGTYGTQGTGSTSNIPGARGYATTLVDASGNLWLLGGLGYDSQQNFGYLNDFWKYSPSTNQWTWVSGSQFTEQQPTYGTQGTPSSSNTPGSRLLSSGWIDGNGKLWFFGGFGIDSQSSYAALNELWKYDPTGGTWTWISGSNVGNQGGVYGTLGTYSSGNVPGSRLGALSWLDNTGHFWMSGGTGFDSNGSRDLLNDLWEYSPSTNQWIWYAGSNVIDQAGTWGTEGTPSTSNIPSARTLATPFTDNAGNFWLFGGTGYDATNSVGILNDLWEITQ